MLLWSDCIFQNDHNNISLSLCFFHSVALILSINRRRFFLLPYSFECEWTPWLFWQIEQTEMTLQTPGIDLSCLAVSSSCLLEILALGMLILGIHLLEVNSHITIATTKSPSCCKKHNPYGDALEDKSSGRKRKEPRCTNVPHLWAEKGAILELNFLTQLMPCG